MKYLSCYRNQLVCGYRPETKLDQVVLFEVPTAADLPAESLEDNALFENYWLKARKPNNKPTRRAILFFPEGGGLDPKDFAAIADRDNLWGRLYYWTAPDLNDSPWGFPGGSDLTSVQLGRDLSLSLQNQNSDLDLEVEWLDGLTVKWTADSKLTLAGSDPGRQRWRLKESQALIRAEAPSLHIDLNPRESENSGALMIECTEQVNPFEKTEICFTKHSHPTALA